MVLKQLLLPEKGRDDKGPFDDDDEPHADYAIALLLGLAQGSKGVDSATRRNLAKKYLYDDIMPPGTFNRRHVQPLLDWLPDELIEYDARYRMHDTYDRMAAQKPAAPALAVVWLDRFHYYYRIWTDLSLE
jgi:hypothetical protein